MSEYRLEFSYDGSPVGERHSIAVPDVATALVVADINVAHGVAELRDGERLVAKLEKQGRVGKSWWAVSG